MLRPRSAHDRLFERLHLGTENEAPGVGDALHPSEQLGRQRLVLSRHIEYWDPQVFHVNAQKPSSAVKARAILGSSRRLCGSALKG
jgi:hypothetical protein